MTCRECGAAGQIPLYMREDGGLELRALYGYRRDDALCGTCEYHALHYGRKIAKRHAVRIDT